GDCWGPEGTAALVGGLCGQQRDGRKLITARLIHKPMLQLLDTIPVSFSSLNNRRDLLLGDARRGLKPGADFRFFSAVHSLPVALARLVSLGSGCLGERGRIIGLRSGGRGR